MLKLANEPVWPAVGGAEYPTRQMRMKYCFQAGGKVMKCQDIELET